MNSIDAWKEMKKGKYVRRPHWPSGEGVCLVSFKEFAACHTEEAVLAEDWEILKQKYKIEYSVKGLFNEGLATLSQYPDNAKITIEYEE